MIKIEGGIKIINVGYRLGGSGWVFSDALLSFEAFTSLDEDESVLGRPKTNGLNPSPKLRGHLDAVMG